MRENTGMRILGVTTHTRHPLRPWRDDSGSGLLRCIKRTQESKK